MPRPQNPVLRETLISAALRLLEEEGPNFSMRTLAQSVGYTVTAVYRCFANREALLTAMQLALFDALGQMLAEALADAPESLVERIGQLGQQFLAWAVEHPVRYQFMFLNTESGVLLSGADRERAQAPLRLLEALLQQGSATGEIVVHDPKMTAILLFSSIHGFASLYCSHRLDGLLEASPQEAFSQWMGPWIQSLGGTP